MKLCINCIHFRRAAVDVAPGKVGMISICQHPDFVNPVDGNHLPVHVVREHAHMCTFNGKGFVAKPEESNKEEALPQQGKLVLVND